MTFAEAIRRYSIHEVRAIAGVGRRAVYLWRRGDRVPGSADKILAGLQRRYGQREGERHPSWRIDWDRMDWSRTSTEIAAAYGVSICTVSRRRRRHAPETLSRKDLPIFGEYQEPEQ